jgi:hypothetical protein
MRFLRRFAAFWYDFVIGDDWIVAVGVVAALGLTALLAHANVTAWWLLPIAVAVFLATSVARAARRSG